jgi:hypothetical protein
MLCIYNSHDFCPASTFNKTKQTLRVFQVIGDRKMIKVQWSQNFSFERKVHKIAIQLKVFREKGHQSNQLNQFANMALY